MKVKNYSLDEYDEIILDVLKKVSCEISNNPDHWFYKLRRVKDKEEILSSITFSNRVRFLERIILPKTIVKTLLYKKVYKKDDYLIYCPHCYHEIAKEETKYEHCPYCGGAIQTRETEERRKETNKLLRARFKETKVLERLLKEELKKEKLKEKEPN